MRVYVLGVRHTLPGVGPVVEPACPCETRRRRTRVGDEIAFAAFYERKGYTNRMIERTLRIEG